MFTNGMKPPVGAAGSGLEFDFDENELEIVRIDDIVFDADLAGIGHPGPERRRHGRLAVEDVQLGLIEVVNPVKPSTTDVAQLLLMCDRNDLGVSVNADAAGFQVEVHAIGDKANAQILDIYERLTREAALSRPAVVLWPAR